MTERKKDTNAERLKKLLKRMIDIYSPSGKEEEILEYLHGYLKRHNLPVTRQEVDDNRYNLVVAPEDVDIELALVGHIDTVVAYDFDEYGFSEKENTVWGLGSADMKGGCAAMIEAFISSWENGDYKIPVALALVVGEEEDGDGAETLVNEYEFPWAVIGEPTDMRACLSHYGYLEMNVVSEAQRMHASMAKRGKNPILSMMRLVTLITQYVEMKRPEMVLNIREMFTSQAGFFVPDYCEAWLDFHFPPKFPIGEIMAELEEVLQEEETRNTALESTIRFTTVDAGYTVPEKGPLVEALRDVFCEIQLEWKPEEFPSHSDANKLWEAGVRPVLLGPGKLEMAHSPEEHASFGQIYQAANLYLQLLAKYAP